MKKSSGGISRRELLKGAAALATAGAVFPQIVPRHVVGGQGFTPPSETVYVAGIGVGSMGGYDIQSATRAGAKVVALCDVDFGNAAPAVKNFPDAPRYKDYRRLLEKEKGIDAVIVGTPDHTHAMISMAAMGLGKHVYCEKPLAHTLYEARKFTQAARESELAVQLGNQGHTYESVHEFCECVWAGTIGEVREIHIQQTVMNYSRMDALSRQMDDHPVPDSLDWDLWLGPAPFRKFNRMYHPGAWRGWTNFGTGMFGDWVCHLVDPVFTALNLGAPTSVLSEAEGYDHEIHGETFPQSSKIRFEFPARGQRPPVTLYWYDGDRYAPPRFEEEGESISQNRRTIGGLVVGDKGKIVYGSHGAAEWRIIPESKMNEYMANRTRVPDPRGSGTPENIAHFQDWLMACKGYRRNASNLDYGGPLTEIALLGNIAHHMPGTELQWDAKNMVFPNAPEANQYLHYPYRDGWTL